MKLHSSTPIGLDEARRRGIDPTRPRASVSGLRAGLAITSIAAAGIHFAVVSDHLAEATSVGVAFAIVAWLQALWAGAVLVSDDRRWLVAGIAGNVVVIAIWAVSRTTGLPVGPVTNPEALGRVDLLATVLETVVVAGCVVGLAGRPRRRSVGRRALVAYASILVLVTTGAIATAGPHGHGGDAHAHGASEPELVAAGGPTSTSHGGPAHFHLAGTEDHADDHDHGGGAVAGAADAVQMASIRSAMQRYADVRVARDEGFIRMDGDYPETGAHFGIPEWTEGGAYSITGDLDLANPEYLMYSKRLTGSWELVAVAYVADMWAYPEPPTSLVGAPYHEHVWNCIEAEGWTLDEEEWGYVSRDECEAKGNSWSPGGEWMTHVWLIPNPEGVFADWNPDLV